MNDKLPPFRMWPHLQAAFGGAFGTLNLLVGAVSIFRQMVRAYDVGVSPVLKNIFAAYVQIFHGIVDHIAGALTWLSGFDLTIPPWAHDWIVLWFVMAGAGSRLIQAAVRGQFSRSGGMVVADTASIAPGVIRIISAWLVAVRSGWGRGVLAYFVSIVLWPVILVQVWFSPGYNSGFDRQLPQEVSELPSHRRTRISFLALFWLQALAIILAIFGLSVLNAQTMSL